MRGRELTLKGLDYSVSREVPPTVGTLCTAKVAVCRGAASGSGARDSNRKGVKY